MPSILKTISHKILLVAIFASMIPETCLSQSNIAPIKNEKLNIFDEILSSKNGKIALKYSKSKRTIWIENKRNNIYKLVHKIDRNANPDLIGSESSIRFVSRSTISSDGDEFFGITFSERSMRGDGGGECGSGAEEYFVAYKIGSDNLVKEIFKKLIGSCIERIDLDTGDGNNNDKSVTSKNGTVTFRWLTYPGTDRYVTGEYNYLTNSISYAEFDRAHVPELP